MSLRSAIACLEQLALWIVAAGASLVFVQNLLFLAGLVSIATGSGFGGEVVTSSLYLDLPGLTLLGIGFLLFAKSIRRRFPVSERRERNTRLIFASGVLCIAWVLLTVAWRIIGMHGLSSTASTASGLTPDSSELATTLSSLFTQVQLVVTTWMVASIALALATILFAWFLYQWSDRKTISVIWPIFGVINAVATMVLAGAILGLTGGEVAFPVLVTGLFLKLAIVPLFGIVAYFSLAWRFVRLAKQYLHTPVSTDS